MELRGINVKVYHFPSRILAIVNGIPCKTEDNARHFFEAYYIESIKVAEEKSK